MFRGLSEVLDDILSDCLPCYFCFRLLLSDIHPDMFSGSSEVLHDMFRGLSEVLQRPVGRDSQV